MTKRSTEYLFFLLTFFLLISSTTSLACTGFAATKNGIVLIGHNKDWWSPDTWIHVYPSENGKYGRMFLEIPYPLPFNSDYYVLAGGFNDHGLCFESFVTPFKLASYSFFKPSLFKNPVDNILQHFTTVQEVIDYVESHNLFFLNYLLCSGQIFVVDQTGDAAIIEGDDIIRIQDDFQVCTNFLQSQPSLGGYPCWRYQTAYSLLENITEISIPLFKTILNATHQQYFTQYSWIYNTKLGNIHLYHYSDYNNEIQIDLTQEFLLPAHSYYLPSLFEPEQNQPPQKPENIIGPSSLKVKNEYNFETCTIDQDNDYTEIYYQWDFGDGTQTYWINDLSPYGGKVSHVYEKSGTYEIKVRARDIYGKESPWSDSHQIQVSKTKYKFINNFIPLL